MNGMARALVLATLWLTCCHAFYIPGWSIKSYKDGDIVPLYVNKVTSDSTQLPYAYSELPFVCASDATKSRIGLNLGEVLTGDRITTSNFSLEFGKQAMCSDLCSRKLDAGAIRRAHELVSSNYVVEWIVDNLPGATLYLSSDLSKKYYASGFPLGEIDPKSGKVYLNNHFAIVIRYREAPDSKHRSVIVGFEVYPKSVATDSLKCPGNKDKYSKYLLDPTVADTVSQDVRYTYSVTWRQDTSVTWADRWSLYFNANDEEATNKYHWLAIVNSLAVASLLSLIVAIVLVRTLNRDIQAYNRKFRGAEPGEEPDKDLGDEDVTGWKLVYSDVFRAPALSNVLASLIGTGMQVFVMASTVIVLACLGVLNPSYRGGLLSYALFSFAFAGVFAGYATAYLNKLMGNEYHWSRSVWLTALMAPAFLLIVVLTLNLVVWQQSSSTALPFGTIVALFCIWLLISCPLVVIGAIIGNKRTVGTVPTRVSAIPRQIPRRGATQSLVFAVLLGSVLPFMVIITELTTIFKSLFKEKSSYYYLYGFLALVFVVLIITVMEMAIITTYFQLNNEDYNWWWRSFLVGSGSAWWVFLYSVYYYMFSLHIDGFVSGLLFFSYSFLGCFVYGLITGSLGFLASYVFVYRIYSAIKVD